MFRSRKSKAAHEDHEQVRQERGSLVKILEISAKSREYEGRIAEKQINVNGLKINYLEGGSGERCVILIHGGVNNTAFSTWSKWNRTIEALSKDYRVFAPDLPGYGASDAPKEATHAFYVRFIGDFLGAVGVERASVIGTSMGGGIAIGYALDNMQSVDSLVAVAPSCLGFSLPRKSRLGLAVPVGLMEKGIEFLEKHKELAARIVKRLVGEERSATIQKAIGFMSEGGVRRSFFDYISNEAVTLKGMARGDRVGLRTDYTERITELNGSDVRVLFIQGDRDELVRTDVVRSAVSRLNNAGIIVFPECKHSPHFQEPELFNSSVKAFLAGNWRT